MDEALLEQIPEEYRDDPSLKDVPDLGTLVKNYINAQSMIGRSIRIPGEDASDEDRERFYERLQQVPGVARLPAEDDAEGRAAFFRRLGAPEKPDDYPLPKLELPEGVQVDPEMEKWFRETAHKYHLTSDQAKGLFQEWTEIQLRGAEALAEAEQQAREALANEWGAELEQRLALANRVAEQLGGEELVAELQRVGLNNSPQLAKLLYEVGVKLMDDQVVTAPGGSRVLPTIEELEERIAEVQGNRDHPYWHADHPEHKAAVRRVSGWYEQLTALKKRGVANSSSAF